ncbi:flavin reductase family protein [Brevibacterium oceani]|jgi:flavin reductase (DIM6/NTAB) family NADH-FMN oxidoreductase RutF|uniref:flavin reductase family protein n=1 Tax=Brevibacterium oceani TaxID=358099 RepID=UPI001B34067A|nr:flavin reductase family protein [Brevibacterium oceani]
MKYDPSSTNRPLEHSPFKALTVPRPIGWLSSVSADGVENIAPYSQWQNLTFDPPMVMFAANQYPDGRRKDTVLNAEETGWFVWNMATWDLREQVNISAQVMGAHESEFDQMDVTRRSADLSATPMIAESPFQYECKYISTHRLPGNSKVGSIDIVYASVERIHLNDDYVTEDGKIDILKAKPIARMGYFDYTVVTETFEMRVPGADGDAQAGLSGNPT